jgi:tRNA A37 threonylcarbamoyltransferase TsaD
VRVFLLVFFVGEGLMCRADNGVMIAWASMGRFLAGDFDGYDIDFRDKWSIEDLAGTKAEV